MISYRTLSHLLSTFDDDGVQRRVTLRSWARFAGIIRLSMVFRSSSTTTPVVYSAPDARTAHAGAGARSPATSRNPSADLHEFLVHTSLVKSAAFAESLDRFATSQVCGARRDSSGLSCCLQLKF